MKSWSTNTIKYLMIAFNMFFVISGIIIIAVGAAVKTVYTDYVDFLDTKYFSLPNMLIATGALIFLISFFGCCGAIKENWLMLAIFSVLLAIVFIFEFSSGIAGYVLRDKTEAYLETTLRNNLANYNETRHSIWDAIQSTFQCCGVDSYNDWDVVFADDALPISCCPPMSGTAGAFYCNSYIVSTTATPSTTLETTRKRQVIGDDHVTTSPNPSTSQPYTTGCKIAFGNYVKKHAVQIGGCALGLAIVQLLGIAFSVHLVRQLRNGYYST